MLTDSLIGLCVIFRVKLIPISARVVNVGGRRAKDRFQQEPTRWPYLTCYGIGYGLIAVYIIAILELSID